MEANQELEISTETEGLPENQVVFHLNGYFTNPALKAFGTAVGGLLDQGRKDVEVDFTNLQYIDSQGVAEIVPIYQVIRQAGGSLKISNPRRLIRHILLSAKLDDIIEIGPAQEDEASDKI